MHIYIYIYIHTYIHTYTSVLAAAMAIDTPGCGRDLVYGYKAPVVA